MCNDLVFLSTHLYPIIKHKIKSGQFNLNFVVGPEFGFNTGYDINLTGSNRSDSINPVVVLKKSNVGLAYGAGLEFAINKIIHSVLIKATEAFTILLM